MAVPARLHLGFLDLDGSLGRRFGSIGLPLDGPGTRLTIAAAPQTAITGAQHERAGRYLEAMQQRLRLAAPVRLAIEETVPPHAGLGSGTQLALAVAAGLRTLFGLPLEPAADALHLGRGRRSGVGVALFAAGGLVTDGGRSAGSGVAPVVSRIPFPDAWHVLLVRDPARQGLSGAAESAAFTRLPPFRAGDAAALCRLALMQVLPAAADADFAGFTAGIAELQRRLGDHYAPVQGGARFASPTVERLLEGLRPHGAAGIGQSSWGPTGFAFAPSAEAAARLLGAARARPEAETLDIRVCRALNRGAEITAHAAAPQG